MGESADAGAVMPDPGSPLPKLTMRSGGRRRRVLFTGIIADTASRTGVRVTVRELSRGGAQIYLPSPDTVGSHPFLILARYGVAMNCRVVWRRAGRAGLQFRDRIDLNVPRDDDALWLQGLWLAAREDAEAAAE
jgi:PilZ domain